MSGSTNPVDAALFDPETAASDDFYRHVNGGWLDANPVPAEYGAWGAGHVVHERNQEILHRLLEEAAGRDDPQGSAGQKVGDYFAAAMDEAAVAAAGVRPLEPYLARIAAAGSVDDVRELVRDLQRVGVGALHALGVAPDFEDSEAYLVYLGQGGLGLPERDYYTRSDEQSEALRRKYVTHVARQLANLAAHEAAAADEAGPGGAAEATDTEAAAEAILAFETRLAEASYTAAQLRDVPLTMNRHDFAALDELMPSFGLAGYVARPRRHLAVGERGQPRLLPGSRRHAGRDPRRDLARLPALAPRPDLRHVAHAGVRERGVRLLRQDAGRAAGDEAALEAGARLSLFGHRRAARATLRRDRVQRAGQAALRGDGGPPAGRHGTRHPQGRMDVRRDAGGGAAQAGRLHLQDRLPGRVARLRRARGRARLLRGEPHAQRGLRAGAAAGTPGQARRPDRVGDAGARRQRLLPPAAQRDRLPRGDPAAAVLLRGRRRRRELRRHRRGHRSRDHARLRRRGQPLRRLRAAARLVGGGRPRRVHAAGRGAGRPVRRLRGRSTTCT